MMSQAEIDILVSKLLGFETFANLLRVSFSVSENLVSEKSLGIGFGQNFGIVIQCLEVDSDQSKACID